MTFLFMLIVILIISIPVSLFAEETSDESLNKRDLFDALKVDYNMIKEATEEGRKISVKEICQRMPDYYYLNEKECNYPIVQISIRILII